MFVVPSVLLPPAYFSLPWRGLHIESFRLPCCRYVTVDGWAFEQLILEKESENKLFDFVHQTKSPDHTYYRWRCYSLANGDTLMKFRTTPFQMYQGGPMWQPPSCPIRPPEPEDATSKGAFSEGVAAVANAAATAGSRPAEASAADVERAERRAAERAEREARARARERDKVPGGHASPPPAWAHPPARAHCCGSHARV